MISRRQTLAMAISSAGVWAIDFRKCAIAQTVDVSCVNQSRRFRHIDSFGGTRNRVGSGGDDTVALKSAMDSGEIIDLTGVAIRISDIIDVNHSNANISSVLSSRIGGRGSSNITVIDDEMPKLFNIRAANFEASGFFCKCGNANSATTLFHFERPAGSAADIDAVLSDIGHESGARLFYHCGRGLKLRNIVSGNVKKALGDLDFPKDWTPNGRSNDTPATAMRAYQFHEIRMHGAASGIRNIGTNALHCGPILASDWLADIGGGPMFVGVSPAGSKFLNLVSSIGATREGGLLDLYAGSCKSTFTNVSAIGIKSSGDVRLNWNPVILRPTAEEPIYDIVFNGGNIGPCSHNGMYILGHGKCYITCIGIGFERTNIDNPLFSPIQIEENSGVFTDVWIKLSACNFSFAGEYSPFSIVGGLNSDTIHVRRDYTSTKPSSIPWTKNLVDNDGP